MYEWDRELFAVLGAVTPPKHGLLGPLQLEQLGNIGFCTADPPFVKLTIASMGRDRRDQFYAKYPFLPKDMHEREYPPLGNREDTAGEQCLVAPDLFAPTKIPKRPPMPGEPL